MNNLTTTRMLVSTAALAAVAALFAGAANAMVQDDDGGAPAVTTVQPSTIPYLSHGIGVDESQFSGQPSVGLTGDSAPKVDRAVAAADEAFDAYRVKSALEARQSLFEDQQPSVGLTGDAALTRDDVSVSSTTQAVSSDDDFDRAWVGIGGGAALLAAAMAGFYFGTRHRGRIALP